MTDIETYKQKLQNLINKCRDKDIIVEILNILESSINKTFSRDEKIITQGINELEAFRVMWGREYDTATFFIANAYESKFQKLSNGSTEKVETAKKAVSEYHKLQTKDNIVESISVLEDYIASANSSI